MWWQRQAIKFNDAFQESKPAVVIVHWDMFPDFPVNEIVKWATERNLPIVELPIKNGRISEDNLSLTEKDSSRNDDDSYLQMVAEEYHNIILVGGYKSLCVRAIAHALKKYGADVKLIDKWLVPDPDFFLQAPEKDRWSGKIIGDFASRTKGENAMRGYYSDIEEKYPPEFRQPWQLSEEEELTDIS